MDLKNDKLKSIEGIAIKYNLDTIGLFGSRAKGDNYEDSDYDIFIIGDISFDDELILEEKLEGILEQTVDLIKLTKEMDKNLAKNILNEGNIIYSKNDSFNRFYNYIDNFFYENNDFIARRERDILA